MPQEEKQTYGLDDEMLSRQLSESKNQARQSSEAGKNKERAEEDREDKKNNTPKDSNTPKGRAGRMADTARLAKKKLGKLTKLSARSGFDWALRASWLSLFPSFLLTFIWINIHAIMHMVFPKFFCELGDEWPIGKWFKQFEIAAFVLVWLVIFSIIFMLYFIFGDAGLSDLYDLQKKVNESGK